LVAQGFTQVYGVDYFDNFFATPLIGGVRLLIAFILHHKLKKVSADVSGAFLNANLRETIYLQLPPGIKFGGSQHVRLLKSLYGLKQASIDWYLLLDEIITAFDPELKRSKTDSCIYIKVTEDCIFIDSVHVDDYGIGYSNQKYYDDFIEHYRRHVAFTISEEFDYMLQMKLEWTANTVTLSQNKQIAALCKKFGQQDNHVSPVTPMQPKTNILKGD